MEIYSHFSNFLTPELEQIASRGSKWSLMEEGRPSAPYNKLHGCWWPGETGSRISCGHGIHTVIPEYPEFGVWRAIIDCQHWHVDGLVQDCSGSSVLATEWLWFCIRQINIYVYIYILIYMYTYEYVHMCMCAYYLRFLSYIWLSRYLFRQSNDGQLVPQNQCQGCRWSVSFRRQGIFSHGTDLDSSEWFGFQH